MKKTYLVLLTAATLGAAALTVQSPASTNAATTSVTAQAKLTVINQHGTVYPGYMDDPSDSDFAYSDANLTQKVAHYPNTAFSKTPIHSTVAYDAIAKDSAGKIVAYRFASGWMSARYFSATDPWQKVVQSETQNIIATSDAPIYSNKELTTKTASNVQKNHTYKSTAVYVEKIGGMGGALAYQIGTNQWVSAKAVGSLSQNGQGKEVHQKAVITVVNSAPLLASPFSNTVIRTLKKGSSWKSATQMTVNGRTYYNLGGDQWVDDANVTVQGAAKVSAIKGVATVHYVKGYGIAVWTNYQNGKAIRGKKLMDGSKWKVFKRATLKSTVNGTTTWYNLGGNQWLDGRYLTVK